MTSRRAKSPRRRAPAREAVAPHVAAEQSEYLARIERIRALYEDTAVPVREIARITECSERLVYNYARRFGWKPRGVALPRRGGPFLPLTDAKRPAFRGRRARGRNAAARTAARCVRAGLLTQRAAYAAVAESRRRAVVEAALKLRRAQAGEAKRLAAAQRKADRAWENEMRALLLIAKMQRAGGPAMRAEFDATLAQVHELFDARLAAAERAAAGADATEAERHIVRALRGLREAPPQPQKQEEGRNAGTNWTSPCDNLYEEERRKELERLVHNLAVDSPPAPSPLSPDRAETSSPSSPGRAEGASPGDPDSYGRAVPSLSGSPGQTRR